MPKMPIITTPNSSSVALVREVIVKSPESFKIEVLSFISILFEENPFVGGFGNRKTDEISYESHGIKKEKVFIINKKSQIQNGEKIIEGYHKLNENLKDYFPNLKEMELKDVNELMKD